MRQNFDLVLNSQPLLMTGCLSWCVPIKKHHNDGENQTVSLSSGCRQRPSDNHCIQVHDATSAPSGLEYTKAAAEQTMEFLAKAGGFIPFPFVTETIHVALAVLRACEVPIPTFPWKLFIRKRRKLITASGSCKNELTIS